jgi:hypothetical protein
MFVKRFKFRGTNNDSSQHHFLTASQALVTIGLGKVMELGNPNCFNAVIYL